MCSECGRGKAASVKLYNIPRTLANTASAVLWTHLKGKQKQEHLTRLNLTCLVTENKLF